jgi:protein-tyrosine phosphatase
MTSTPPGPHGQTHWRLLFVCLGNICRSPLAAGVFRAVASERNVLSRFTIDSCGLGGWHVGEDADPRAAAVARRHGITLNHRARQLAVPDDFERFDLLLAMDRQNVHGLLRAGGPPEKVRLLRTFEPVAPGMKAPQEPEVPDPYYGGPEGFDTVYAMVRRSCEGLLAALLTQEPPR